MIIWEKKHDVCIINPLRICCKLITLNIKTISYSHVKQNNSSVFSSDLTRNDEAGLCYPPLLFLPLALLGKLLNRCIASSLQQRADLLGSLTHR